MNQQIKNILEAALMVADEPLNIERMLSLFQEEGAELPDRQELKDALEALEEDYVERGIELKHVASGYRIQAKSSVAQWVNKLWTERPPRYTRALLETIAIIAYRQPITRGEIEAIRGVSVSTNVIKTLLEREWVKVAGHRDVPGRPAVYASTRQFLDYFNLKSISELPTLAELRDLDEIAGDLFSKVEGNKTEANGESAAEASESAEIETDAESTLDSGEADIQTENSRTEAVNNEDSIDNDSGNND